MAVAAMAEALDLDFGFELTIEKGIPLGSGLGGSAASAVAAVVAANALLDRPLDNLRLLKFAMQGELVASGTAHIDNIAPSLYGGLVLCVGIDNPHIKQIPVPSTVRSVLVRPHRILETRGARAILGRTVPLSDVVWQQANLAGLVTGCFTADLPLIAASLEDVADRAAAQGPHPGLSGGQERRDVARRARLFDLRRGTDDVRLGGGGQGGRRSAPAWWTRFARRASRATRGSRGSSRSGAKIVHEQDRPMRFISTRGGAAPVTLSDAILARPGVGRRAVRPGADAGPPADGLPRRRGAAVDCRASPRALRGR